MQIGLLSLCLLLSIMQSDDAQVFQASVKEPEDGKPVNIPQTLHHMIELFNSMNHSMRALFQETAKIANEVYIMQNCWSNNIQRGG